MTSDELVAETVRLIRTRSRTTPRVGIILGSGLGGLADRIDADAVIPYDVLPGFANSTASGHRGELILGRLDLVDVVAMSGRFHRYEGWSAREVAFPVQVLRTLGASTLIVSNASGGVRPGLAVGDIVVIRDHINWLGNLAEVVDDVPVGAPTFLQRHDGVYDSSLARLAMQIAVEQRISASYGVYLATLGPNYETRSEYRMMRRMGVDVVGMSTVPEVLMAAQLRLPVLGLSMVSNVANPDQMIHTSHADVLAAGREAEARMGAIVRGVLRQVAQSP